MLIGGIQRILVLGGLAVALAVAVSVSAAWAEEDEPRFGEAKQIEVIRVEPSGTTAERGITVHAVVSGAGQQSQTQAQTQTQTQTQQQTQIQSRVNGPYFQFQSGSSDSGGRQAPPWNVLQRRVVAPPAGQQAVTEWIAQAPLNAQGYYSFVSDMDECTGAVLLQADSAVKTQLGLPDDRGLVVVHLAPMGPAAQVGLQPNDILLELGDKPLNKTEDVLLILEQVPETEKSIDLKLLRSGKPLKIAVRPVRKVLLGSAETPKTEYYIGTPATPIDETLRAHLDLPEGVGLVISDEIVPESPAAKAGLKKNDILLKFGDDELKGVESLVAAIQKTQGKTTTVVYLRKGEKLTAEITPAVRKDETAAKVLRMSTMAGMPGFPWGAPPVPGQVPLMVRMTNPGAVNLARPGEVLPMPGRLTIAGQATATDADTVNQLKDLSQQVQDLKKTIAELRQALGELRKE